MGYRASGEGKVPQLGVSKKEGLTPSDRVGFPLVSWLRARTPQKVPTQGALLDKMHSARKEAERKTSLLRNLQPS